ncbi:hypothetical protein M406DRAFT_354182 [Cryphonectria parasitica EP155]|uniref:Uncharacterized protein n=1 Tax=Cryphonectria parasitica (strain ATCC 38755 / EP155) TaxID=660469 RepID=A0A9P4YBC4_CRYP1|nr:uncharacterized protein M406DRAFT_354182 [Cryphonectria parasitica EP155]KAF3769931.1 hypothetical protein M406DRAFT_354182 [Cryphonectria parasitica EP155]
MQGPSRQRRVYVTQDEGFMTAPWASARGERAGYGVTAEDDQNTRHSKILLAQKEIWLWSTLGGQRRSQEDAHSRQSMTRPGGGAL